MIIHLYLQNGVAGAHNSVVLCAVDQFLLKPHCVGEIVVCRAVVNLLAIIFSRILHRIQVRAIGLYEFICSLFFPDLRISITTTEDHNFRKIPLDQS